MRESVHRINSALAGRYSIEREIGSGGMATVHLAMDLKHGRKVALKTLAAGADARMRERFQRESRATAKLHHPNIVPIYDVGEVEGTQFFTMALIEGSNLAELIHQEKASKKKGEDLVAAFRLAVTNVPSLSGLSA